MVEGMSVVVNAMLSLMSVMSPPPALCNLSVRTVVKLCTLGVFALCVSLVCFDSIYVDLQYDKIYLTFIAVSVSVCCVCSHVVVFGLSVRLSWYPMWMRWLL